MNNTAVRTVRKKGYDKHNFSYASPEDPFFKRAVIQFAEKIAGKDFAQGIYNDLHAEGVTPITAWRRILEKLNITLDFDESQLDKVPQKGPLIFIANHPFGILDGVILCYLAAKKRHDYFLLVNEVLSKEPIMKDHLLPVDFRGDERARQRIDKTKNDTAERLGKGECLVIFPSGGVATRFKWFGKVKEWSWKKFICTQIHRTQCTVVPVFFHGKNSELFQVVSKISMTARLGLLLHEVRNKRNKTFRVEIGDPLPYEQMAHMTDRQALIDFLYRHTMTEVGNKRPEDI